MAAPRGAYWEIAFNSCPPAGSPICTGPAKGVKVKVVQDPAIRKALAYGINRESFAQTVYLGQAVTAYGLISPRFKLYYQDLSKDPKIAYNFDPAKAKAILKAGGWNCSTTPCTKNGVKAEFELATLSDSDRKADGPASGADARKLGIVINLTFQSEDALNNRIYASGKTKDKYAPNYDAFLWDWDVGGVTPTPILEVLRRSTRRATRSTPARSSTLRCRRQSGGDGGRHRRCGAEVGQDRARRPPLPAARASQGDRRRASRHVAWLDPLARARGEPIYQITQQILALQPGPAPRERARRRRATVATTSRLADDAALRADRLRADLARDHRVDVHRERAPQDRAARVD